MIFGERKYSMRLWLDPVAARRAPAHRRRRRQRAARAERATSPPAASATRRRARGRPTRSACAPPGGCARASEFENVIVKAGADGTLVRLSDVGSGGARRRDLFVAAALPGRSTRSASASSRCRPPTRSTSSAASRRSWSGCRRAFPPGLEYRIAFDTTDGRAGVDRRSRRDAGRGRSAWSSS